MTYQLRCQVCGAALNETATGPMFLFGLLRRSHLREDAKLRHDQVARRCRACDWVNIFRPLREQDALIILGLE